MGGSVVHKDRTHICMPGWSEFTITDSDIPALNGRIGLREDHGIRPGDVWQCECGRTWVAYRPQYSNMVYFGVKFRPEGRIARWRRERRVATDTAKVLVDGIYGKEQSDG